MPKTFRLQDPGEGIHEVEIQEIQVKEGDRVEEGQTLFVVESDKAAVELPSPYAGQIASIDVEQGQTVEVGASLLTIADEAEGAAAEKADAERCRRKERPESGSHDAANDDGGPRPDARPDTDAGQEGDQAASRHHSHRPTPATPATRGVARDLGVGLDEVEGTGPDGRVTDKDVRAAAGERPQQRPGPSGFERWGEVERVPLRSVRKATARRVARSWAEIPHVTHEESVDVTDLERFRSRHAPEVEQAGGKLTLTVLAMKAVVGALREHPRFNASLDGEADEIVLKRYFNIGVALDSEQGLVVPVIRNAERKSLAELAVELTELAERLRQGQAKGDELKGGSFTITNIGALGGDAFQPIINHPEAAILGMARARLEPVLEGDLDRYEIRPRLMLPLCLAFDHRLNDGADAARFMATLVRLLGDPEELALGA